MRLLLDTHYFLWLVSQPERLSAALRADLASPLSEVYVSTVCVWEIAIKHALGRLQFPMAAMDATMQDAAFIRLPITHAHAITAGALPRLHHDPLDRMLVAQAQIERLTLVTADCAIRRYNVALYGAI